MFVLVRILSFIFSKLPPAVSLFFARVLGRIYYFFDPKHRRISYHNLRLALAKDFQPSQLKRILKSYYLNMLENFVEVLYMSRIDSLYIRKYIKIEGVNYLKEALQHKKGIIVTSGHFGNWEVPNIVCKYLFPDRDYFVLAKEQPRIGKLGELLNQYRHRQGYNIISTNVEGLRKSIEALKNGAILGMVIDQGMGKSDLYADFFNHRVRSPVGAIKLSLEFDVPVFLTYIRRIKGPVLSLTILPAIRTQKEATQIQAGVQELNNRLEDFIRKFPQDYLWQFKRFKSRLDRKILILNDTKAGHLRQSQAVANELCEILKMKGFIADVEIIDIEFNSHFTNITLALLVKFFWNKFAHWYLKSCLKKDCYNKLLSICPDFVISAGNSLAGLNILISKENQAKSIVAMKPSLFSLKKFDLAIIPRHDRVRAAKNIVRVDVSPNLIDEAYLEKNSLSVSKKFNIDTAEKRLKIGLLIGGDTKYLKLTKELVRDVCDKILTIAKENNAQILVSSSRRTNREIEQVLKEKFTNQSNCPLLIIANEKNFPEAVGGILGLCQIVVVSGDSISMVCEAVSSGKEIIVFKLPGRESLKHNRFLASLKGEGLIYFSDSKIDELIKQIWLKGAKKKTLEDKRLIRQALERILL
ncbi:MAG: ELM1/GtrOC1 family putative glycosyltransferase [Candidatus Omnitrophota bacterium]